MCQSFVLYHLFLSLNALISHSCGGWGSDGSDLGFERLSDWLLQDEGWLPGTASGLGDRPDPRGTGVPCSAMVLPLSLVLGPQQQCVGRTVLPAGSLSWSAPDYQPGMVLLSPRAVFGWWLPCL